MLLNLTDPSTTKEPLRAAAEDAIVAGGVALCSGLIATQQFPPNEATLWATGLAAALIGLIAWARARSIYIGPKE